MRRIVGYLIATGALAALASLFAQRPTEISMTQIAAPVLAWDDVPAHARMPCLAGQMAVDEQYRIYVCIPDEHYMRPGHQPRLWVRLVPDATYLPGGY